MSSSNKLEAFNAVKLVEKLPLKIYAVASWGDNFMLSTVSTKNEANLLVYKVIQGTHFAKPFESKLEKVVKKFTGKPATELAVIPEQRVFLALTSDNELVSADLGLFELTHGFPVRMKGVLCFAVDWYSHKCNKVNLQLAVAFKRRIIVYKYKRDVFVQTYELPVPDVPRSVHWIGQGLIFCIKKDLYHLTLDGESKELFSIGQNRNDPCLLTISRGDKPEILVLKDDKQISLDSSAKPTQPVTLNWTEQPLQIEYVHPYVIGILPKGIEVRALEQKILVQNIRIAESVKDQIKYISSDHMTIVASQTLVFLLDPRAYDIQVQQLVLQKQFELALELAELIKESELEHKIRRDEILKRYAFYLFTQFKFEQSLKYYLEIKEDPVHVIGLYPHLLPSEIKKSVTDPLPTTPPTLSGDDLQRGIQCLISYLTQMRYTEQQKLQQFKESGDDSNPSDESKKVMARLQLIDTTLLKCYVKTKNNTLIGSLVRLRDNHLHIAESERILRNEDRFKELVDLFNTKGLHPKALELLLQFKKGPNQILVGVWPTIDYLQNLTKDNIVLILKYSKWVLNSEPSEGLKIFTEEVGDVRNFPRLEVFEHIKECAPDKAIDYLEHIIYKWSEDNPFFHNSLIILYKDIIERLLPSYLLKNKGRAKLKAGEEPGELGLNRSKLLNFLHYSQHYEPEGLISKFPFDSLFEERALLLGRLGRHDIALAIYAHVLSDPQMAEEYCRKIYDPEKEENREVYLSLVEMYLHPPKMSELGIESNNVHIIRDDEKAMKILQQYHSKIDTAKVLGMLPEDTRIQTIEEFIATVLEERTVRQRTLRLLLNLMITEQIQVQKDRIREESPYFVIDEDTQCSICGKKLLTSAFARNPSGEISHLYCYQKLIAESEDY